VSPEFFWHYASPLDRFKSYEFKYKRHKSVAEGAK
jgi:hypothetical protein